MNYLDSRCIVDKSTALGLLVVNLRFIHKISKSINDIQSTIVRIYYSFTERFGKLINRLAIGWLNIECILTTYHLSECAKSKDTHIYNLFILSLIALDSEPLASEIVHTKHNNRSHESSLWSWYSFKLCSSDFDCFFHKRKSKCFISWNIPHNFLESGAVNLHFTSNYNIRLYHSL